MRGIRIRYPALLALALLLSAPAVGHAQVIQDMGDEPAAKKKPARKKLAKKTKAVQEPAIGGRVLSECSALEATERLSAALTEVRGVGKLRTAPGQTIVLSYRGREVNLAITAHGSCQSSFQASLPYRRRPGEEGSIRRAYTAVMEPAVAALAECDPKACLEARSEAEASFREERARDEATTVASEVSGAATRAGATPESAEQQARSAAALAYLSVLSSEDAYKETVGIVRDVLPTPLTAQFPEAGSKGVSVTLLETAPPELAGGSELEALRSKIRNDALSDELRERLATVLSDVEEQISGPCYHVTGFVDFQNRCGALVRGRYEAYVSRREGSSWFALGEPAVDFPDCPGR
jgi:hypothetical protein